MQNSPDKQLSQRWMRPWERQKMHSLLPLAIKEKVLESPVKGEYSFPSGKLEDDFNQWMLQKYLTGNFCPIWRLINSKSARRLLWVSMMTTSYQEICSPIMRLRRSFLQLVLLETVTTICLTPTRSHNKLIYPKDGCCSRPEVRCPCRLRISWIFSNYYSDSKVNTKNKRKAIFVRKLQRKKIWERE